MSMILGAAVLFRCFASGLINLTNYSYYNLLELY